MMERKEGGHGTLSVAQLSVLRGDVPSRSAQRETPEILFRTELPQGEQGGESARVAGQTGEPGLLPRTRECRAGAVMASGASGVLAATGRTKRGGRPDTPLALQDRCQRQGVEIVEDSQSAPEPALQDLWRDQPAVLIGFIAQFTGSALQDDIARSARRLLKLGHDILAGRIFDDHQTGAVFRSGPADSGPVQLG